ncbi:subunit P of phosphatidylinositol N-acetylglucosaminyltransferase [Cordyceps javanica]|uniref:Subunit P of phosphatidylinositol N-acetylglucosaminyltransferase n=1 Tax=Cordyceps javanica TaxID=43265 RepID=A0A545VA77_9HYPO|nr:subunit P of phosphatidylinositol N-acetylglucosaminyltransferase [Cordyceps javanica]TQW09837.1 subunit P of phosphatidylinositol N-acetylglucosaminyltransferase [Cordyceps javanica]
MPASSNEGDAYLSDNHSSSGSSGDDDDESPPRPAGPVPQNFFAPPFYGRPPTPLPPSPSLTSLLRPSRPTTPDASDDEHHATTTTATTTAAATAVPHAAPRVPTYEYYGFVLYLLSSFAFLMYLLWSYLPAPFLHGLGIRYYPDRWWALAAPAFLVTALCYIYVALASYNREILTLPLHRVETVVDDAGQLAVVDAKGRLRGSHGSREPKLDARGGLRWRDVWSEGTDAVLDIPLSAVCEVLYGEGRDVDEDEEDLWMTPT